MIQIKNRDQIIKMQRAGRILADCHKEIRKKIAPGVTTMEINRFVEEYLEGRGATPEQKGYEGFPYAICASVNDAVCHGFPTHTPLANGDIVTIDTVVNYQGWLADSAWSYAVGDVGDQAGALLRVTKEALYVGIGRAVIGNRVGDISNAVQSYAEERGFSVVREYTGHGIGTEMHEEPTIPHFGRAGRGLRLAEGMVFTIEPMVTAGQCFVTIDPRNHWEARTRDGSLCAQFEHTLAITKNGPIILTDQGDGERQ